MHDTLLSLQRAIESKMCLTGRRRKLWFLSKKKKKVLVSSLWQKISDVSLYLFQQQRRLDLLTITNPGEYACFALCACVFVIHCTLHHTTTLYSQTRLCVQRGRHTLWLLLLLTTSISSTPRAKTCKKRALFSRFLFSAFPWSHRLTPGVPVPEQRVQPVLLCLYGKLNVFSVHLGEGWNCIQSSGRDRWGNQEGCSPICLKYLAALIHFD